MVNFSDIDLAFHFVSGAEFGINSAFLCRDTGQIYFESGFGDSDELPEDIEDSNRYIQIPHKRDLDLGIELVREFVIKNLPEKAGEIENFFRSRGAYTRYKELLSKCNTLEKWYQFEQVRIESALKNWCIQNNIQIEENRIGDRTIGSNGGI